MREIKENIVYPARFQTESGGGVRITFPDFPELLVIAGDWQEGMELAQRQLALAVIDRLDSGRELPAWQDHMRLWRGLPLLFPLRSLSTSTSGFPISAATCGRSMLRSR